MTYHEAVKVLTENNQMQVLRFWEKLNGAEQTALLAQIAEDGTLVWRVVIDPETGALIGQELKGDVNTEVSGDALLDPYVSLSVAYSEQQSVLFSAVDEPVAPLDLSTNGS